MKIYCVYKRKKIVYNFQGTFRNSPLKKSAVILYLMFTRIIANIWRLKLLMTVKTISLVNDCFCIAAAFNRNLSIVSWIKKSLLRLFHWFWTKSISWIYKVVFGVYQMKHTSLSSSRTFQQILSDGDLLILNRIKLHWFENTAFINKSTNFICFLILRLSERKLGYIFFVTIF